MKLGQRPIYVPAPGMPPMERALREGGEMKGRWAQVKQSRSPGVSAVERALREKVEDRDRARVGAKGPRNRAERRAARRVRG